MGKTEQLRKEDIKMPFELEKNVQVIQNKRNVKENCLGYVFSSCGEAHSGLAGGREVISSAVGSRDVPAWEEDLRRSRTTAHPSPELLFLDHPRDPGAR